MDGFDLVILGGGSAAFAAAIKASDLGAHVALIERRTLGGTCANRGCLPSKNLIEAARIVHEAAHPRFSGLTAAAIGVDFRELVCEKGDLVHDYRSERYETVAAGLAGLEVIAGDARFSGPHTIDVAGRRITAERVLIATGSRPTIPSIPGLEDVPYLTSDLLDADEPSRLDALPGSLVLLGGGPVAVELAQLFARLGSRVTLVTRSVLLRRYEPELAQTLSVVLEAEGIELATHAKVDRVESTPAGIRAFVETETMGRIVGGERILLASGRTPNTDGLGLAEAGVTTDPTGSVVVNAELRTRAAHIWAAGDVIGRQHGSQLATPVGARQGRIAAENALTGSHRRFDGTVIPRAVFTDPPIGTVGLTEAEVKASHRPAVSTTTPLRYVPRAAAIHRQEGVVKLIASTVDERVLGAHMIGEGASEVIHEAAMALKLGAKLSDFVELVHVYPTMAEALKIGAQAFSRDVSKLSCCAE
jgi:mercuric reductase